ncbi:uncharacterized protein LOC124923912 [Impatiens glandulifera]|uniref:uncharacterized protein LOC124923912 n=1 Tax=Impatiens glandulifera TaxID=253017 RepID=UPI001FB1935C|nr:uncharacterized protein LOC124923912 [Impatiens glandulifera]
MMAMAAPLTKTPVTCGCLAKPTRFKLPKSHKFSYIKPNPFLKLELIPYPSSRLPSSIISPLSARTTSSSSSDDKERDAETILPSLEDRPVNFLLLVVLWASVSLAWFAYSSDAKAAVDSIRASSFGVKIASSLRGLDWPDEAVVFSLATLPIIELRGAIPVGYWLQLNPFNLTLLSILGNMVPVPLIMLYLKRFASLVASKNETASRMLEMVLENAKRKAGPVEEFQWLGLMLFVAVPLPGTGAWTGAIIASILDMPFWDGLSANFFGVVLAGLLVNLLVNLGLKYAIVAGVILFIISTYMWGILRGVKN